METITKHSYKTETLNPENKGLDIYLKPFIFQISEDKKRFYYSEIGVLVSAHLSTKGEFYQEKINNKFIVSVQYDYRSGDDLNNFNFCKNTGTYGKDLIFDNLEDAINGTLDFLDSDFTQFKTFHGETIEQQNIVSVREVAKSQSLHHCASFREHIKKDDLYLNLIIKAGEEEELNRYTAINENRFKAELKFRSKLSSTFLENFGFEVSEIVIRFKVHLGNMEKKIKFEDMNPKQKNIIRHLFRYYN